MPKRAKKGRKTGKPKTPEVEEHWIPPDLKDLNHTELALLCQTQGAPRPSRDIPREAMIKVLEGEEPPEILGDVTAAKQAAIDKFLSVYNAGNQLRCDRDHAKCPPARILECFNSAMPEIEQYVE